MCGRYYADTGTEQKVKQLVVNRDFPMRAGDIHPSERATVLNGSGKDLVAADMTWGFPGYQGNGLLINARANREFEEAARLNKEGRVFMISPSKYIPASMIESDLEKLGELYYLGYEDGKNAVQGLKDYLDA